MRYRIIAVVGFLWLLLDLVTKKWAESVGIAHKNTGIAFSIDLPLWLQIGISVLLIGILLYYALFSVSRFLFPDQLLFGIILGGAFGNLISRIQSGYVIDFIRLGPIPIFNIADVGITGGITLLLLIPLIQNLKRK